MSNLTKRFITAIFLMILIASLFFLNCYQFNLFIFSIWLSILLFEWPKFFSITSYKFWLIFSIYPTIPLISLGYLYCHSKTLALLAIIISFSHDTGSYIFGKRLGKNKICPLISPNKTWEGFFGGYLFNIIFTTIFFNIFFKNLFTLSFILYSSAISSTIAFLGDILESYLKRKANIKDSGNILPGHGGILDRIDSLLLVALMLSLLNFK